jgi:glycosyltransferase involved in cell wall biosynthesis
MMRRFLLDVRFARPHALDGVGRALWNTVAALGDVLDHHERVGLMCHADDVDAWHRLAPFAEIHVLDVPVASLAQHAAWPRAVASAGAHVVHYPQYDMPLVPAGVASVATVHDFTTLDEPSYFGNMRGHRRLAAAALLAGTCARATTLTTLSNAVASEIIRRIPGTASRVRIVVPGPSRLPMPASAVERGRDVLVYIGNHRPHKRVPFLMRVFARYRAERPHARLLLIGRRDARFPEVIDALDGPLGAGVSLIEGANDAKVGEHLAQARALVFPSVGEGYGFPVVEALSVGTPAIAARASSASTARRSSTYRSARSASARTSSSRTSRP